MRDRLGGGSIAVGNSDVRLPIEWTEHRFEGPLAEAVAVALKVAPEASEYERRSAQMPIIAGPTKCWVMD